MNSIRIYNLSVADVARILGYHPQTVRDKAAAGTLPAIKRGRKWIFSDAAITEYLHKQTQEGITDAFDRKLHEPNS